MISKIKAVFYNYIEDLVKCIPNDAVLGGAVRKYVNGNSRTKKRKQNKQTIYKLIVRY